MSYIEKSLLPEENIQYKGKLHAIVFARGIFIAFLGLVFLSRQETRTFGLCLLSVAVLILSLNYIDFITSEFSITNKRVVIRFGWLRRSSLELFHDRIESVSVNQGIVGRIVNFGQLGVRGVGGTVESFRNIAAPLEFRHQVQLLTQAK